MNTINNFPTEFRVIGITKTERLKEQKPTYDIEVDEVHAFSTRASGSQMTTISHNSALIALFSPDDEDMLTAKTGEWFINNPQRGRSNNSAVLVRDETTKEQFSGLVKNLKEFGEPGFIWTENKDIAFNPCLTGDTLLKTKEYGEITIEKVIEYLDNDKVIHVLSYNIDSDELHKAEYKQVTAGQKTRKKANVIKITMENGEVLKLTPDHKVFTKNKGYIKAINLCPSDEIISI